jgi:hypothetical protein
MGPLLSIGMAVHDDYQGAWFTIQALRWYHDTADVEFVVVANSDSAHLRHFLRSIPNAVYVEFNGSTSTSQTRNRIFQAATGRAILALDCHVLLAPGAIARLKQHYESDHSLDLFQGPCVHDDLRRADVCWSGLWDHGMQGKWAPSDYQARDPWEPHEIAMQGLGLFSCRREAWLDFHPGFRGYGGEEGYIHEKYRRAGRRVVCLPWLRWAHFYSDRPSSYENKFEDRIYNYALGFTEQGRDLEPMVRHMKSAGIVDALVIDRVVAEGIQDAKRGLLQ